MTETRPRTRSEKARWLRRRWRPSAKGNDYINFEGFNVVVFEGDDGWRWRLKEQTGERVFAKRWHGTPFTPRPRRSRRCSLQSTHAKKSRRVFQMLLEETTPAIQPATADRRFNQKGTRNKWEPYTSSNPDANRPAKTAG